MKANNYILPIPQVREGLENKRKIVQVLNNIIYYSDGSWEVKKL